MVETIIVVVRSAGEDAMAVEEECITEYTAGTGVHAVSKGTHLAPLTPNTYREIMVVRRPTATEAVQY